MPPAVKRMQQTHRLFLIVAGAALHNGTDQHLNQPAADGIGHYRKEDARKSVRQQPWQHHQSDQSGSGKCMGKHNGDSVTNPVNKPG